MRRIESWLCSLILAVSLIVAAPPAFAAGVYPWRPEMSDFTILTDRSGLFGRMGHRHTIRAQQFTGSVEWDSALPEAVRIDLVIDAKSLKVTDDDLDPGDVAKVQQDMETKVLEVEKHPEIHFLSNVATLRESSDGKWALDVNGTLALHGVSQPVIVPLTVEMSGNVLHLKGETTLRQKDYEIDPVSVGLGTVKVKNEVKIQFNLVAEATPPAAATSDSSAAADSSASEASRSETSPE